MLYFMVYSAHGLPKDYLMTSYANTGFLIIIASILLIEANAIFGKMHSSVASVRGVITSSFVLTFIFSGLSFYL